jgi:N-acylneuraminate cytidylyltransferase/CMP-N,N'-diacetyllegionaminic acid synthase
MKYTAVVPARSGSKRLPDKNVRILGGKPLAVWTLEACVDSGKVDEVIFSTDSMEYWDLVRGYVTSDKLTLDYRTPSQAGDNVKIFDYLKGESVKIFEDRQGCFLLALPTCPFRETKHIDEAIALHEQTGSAVFSATPFEFSVNFAFNLSEAGWTSLLPDSPMITGNTRGQDQMGAFHPNGAIYVRKIADLLNSGLKTLYDEATPYIMTRDESTDIDEESDFLLAEALISAKVQG